MASAQLVANVAAAEGCPKDADGNAVAYKDSLGNWTIGYGHLLQAGIDWAGHTITTDVANELLSQDLDERAEQCATLPEWAALDTQARQDGVVECVFNLGLGHWSSEFPRTRSALQAKLWQSAAVNLLNSPQWVSQVGLKRVQRIAQQIQSGAYPS
jgi:GH24 family phage-related lysozyme (muramidase)